MGILSNTQGRNLLRAQVGTPVLYRIFNIAYGLLFSGVVLVMIFNTQHSLINFRWNWLILLTLLGVGFFYLLYRLVCLLPELDGRVEGAVVAILFVLYAALQFFAGWQLRVLPTETWDFGVVFTSAQEYVLNGTKPGDYFLYFPNNSGLYLFWTGFMFVLKQMGLREFTTAAMVLNLLLIDLSIYLLYRCARRLFGMRRAVLVLVAAFLTLPFILYVPVYYTDTLTLVFPIGAVYLWLKARSAWRAGEGGKAIKLFCILSALLGLGALLKVSVLIVWVAIVLDALLFLRGKGRLPMLLGGLGAVALLYGGGGWLVRHAGALPAYDYSLGIPFTHWIMMGLRGTGGYYDPDYQWTLAAAADKAGRFTATTGEISGRLSDFGFGGTISHLVNKLAYTFGDGTYTAVAKLDHSVVAPGSFLHEFAVPTGKYVGFTAYYAFTVQVAMVVGMVVSAVKSVLRKNDCLTFTRVAVFGLVLFLLVWETRARYLVNFLPLMLLCAVEAFPAEGASRKKAPMAEDAQGTVQQRSRRVRAEGKTTHKKKPQRAAEAAKANVAPAAAVEELTQTGEDAFDLFSPELDDMAASPLADNEKKQKLVTDQQQTQIFEPDQLDDVPPPEDPFFDIARTMRLELDELNRELEKNTEGKSNFNLFDLE